MKRQLVFAVLILLAGIPLHLYAQTGGGLPGMGSQTTNGQAQQPGNVDCSDPLMASSSLCGGLGSTMGGNGTGLTGLGSPQMGVGQQFFSYTDNQGFEKQAAPARAVKTQPGPLTEFQKFVATTTGEVLPIFGAELFREVPTTFSPVSMAPVPPDYVIGPGDQIRVRVWGQVNFSANVRVDRSGQIYLPQVGEVQVAGLPYSELENHLRAAIGRVYKNFQMTAELGQIRSIQVYVTGQARRPGMYTVSSLSTLVDALFESGGPSPTGSLRHIELLRGGREVTDFDLYALLIHGDKSKDVPLQPGDVIFIPAVGPEAALTGSVRNPAIYELRDGETLADAIADAGGASAVAAETQVSIERTDDHRQRYAMDVAWNEAGLGTKLADGDLVRLNSIVPSYAKTVTLRGNTANPGRFAWHEGMRLSDLIPDRASLVTRNYWWKRAQLGLPAPEFEPMEDLQGLRQPTQPEELRQALAQEGSAEQTRPSAGQGGSAGTAVGPGAGTEGNPGEMGMGTGPAQAGPPSGQPEEATPEVPAAERSGSGSLAAGYEARPPHAEAARTEVGPIAADIDWDYAVIERLDPKTLKTRLIPFDLGRLVMDHDQDQDLELQPGDVVTVFSQADIRVPQAQETKFVRLEGEFVHSGVYTVRPGETLRELVQRAGGLTPDAYLYGSQFTRESTRALQQQRMDEYVEQLQMEMERSTLALASTAAVAPQAMSGSAAAQSGEQGLIGRLRQMRATGRIVLQFNYASKGMDAIPDIALENGDRFVVPPVPASVNVVGAVYDQNSFLFRPGMRAGMYLHLAGGPDRDADRKHMFIIRADGSVVSRDADSTIWGNQFDSLPLYAGDTIVVPEKVFKPSAMLAFMGWSQLFSQFALGAAALSVVQ